MIRHLSVTRAMKATLRNVVGGKTSVTATFRESFRVGSSSKLKNLLDLLPSVCISIVVLNEEQANDGCMEYAQLCQQGERFLIRHLQDRDRKQIKAIFECKHTMMIAFTAIGDQDPSTFKILCVLVIHFVGKDFFYISFFATNPGKFVPSFDSKGDNNNWAGRGLLTSMVVLAYELA